MAKRRAKISLQGGVWMGDQNRIVRTLDAGADPNGWDARGNTPLVIAAMEGHTAIVAMLLDRGGDPSICGEDGTTLHWAMIHSDADMAHRLIGAGANVSWRDLEASCARYIVTVTEAILDRGVDVNGGTQDGGTALMSAAFVGDTETARLLLDRGADVNARTVTGWAALLSAAAKGHTAMVRLLLDAGADITTQDKDGDTALKLALEAGHAEVAQVLYNVSMAI